MLGELEERVVAYLQKGEAAEAEVLGSVAAALPETLKDALPEPLKDALRPRAPSSSSSNGSGNGGGGGGGTYGGKPLATWTITSDANEVVVGVEEEYDSMPPMTPAAIAASQTGAWAARHVHAAGVGCTDGICSRRRGCRHAAARLAAVPPSRPAPPASRPQPPR